MDSLYIGRLVKYQRITSGFKALWFSTLQSQDTSQQKCVICKDNNHSAKVYCICLVTKRVHNATTIVLMTVQLFTLKKYPKLMAMYAKNLKR